MTDLAQLIEDLQRRIAILEELHGIESPPAVVLTSDDIDTLSTEFDDILTAFD